MKVSKGKKSQGFTVDNFTKRGLRRPRGAPYNVIEYLDFDCEYRRFLLSTKKIEVTFFNGESFEILYNFDATRTEKDRLLINWDTLSPLFGGVTPPGCRNFVRLSKITSFVEKHIHLDQCDVGLHNSCFCGRTPPDDLHIYWDSCSRQHFHHFCSVHVRSWLLLYLYPKILMEESEELFHESLRERHATNPDVLEYYSTGKYKDTWMLLDSARFFGYSSPQQWKVNDCCDNLV